MAAPLSDDELPAGDRDRWRPAAARARLSSLRARVQRAWVQDARRAEAAARELPRSAVRAMARRAPAALARPGPNLGRPDRQAAERPSWRTNHHGGSGGG